MKVTFSVTGVGKRRPFSIQNTYFKLYECNYRNSNYLLFGETGKRSHQIHTHFII